MDWKKTGRKLLFPPAWLTGLLTLASAVSLITVFIKGWEQTILAYAVYVLSFYTLAVVTLVCVKAFPRLLSQIKQRFSDTPFGSRYMSDGAFRRRIALYLSFGISMLYVGINLWSWYSIRSWWFVVLAGYYSIMAVMRFLLVRYVRSNELGASILEEWKRARSCAWILLLVNLSLSSAVLMILYQNKGYNYPGILIYVMALYTFYSTAHAIVEIVRCRRSGSPILSASQVVSLSAALVSMLNLETAMFAQFGAELSAQSQRIFIILTGAGVSIIVVTLSVLLIITATKEIRRKQHGK